MALSLRAANPLAWWRHCTQDLKTGAGLTVGATLSMPPQKVEGVATELTATAEDVEDGGVADVVVGLLRAIDVTPLSMSRRRS